MQRIPNNKARAKGSQKNLICNVFLLKDPNDSFFSGVIDHGKAKRSLPVKKIPTKKAVSMIQDQLNKTGKWDKLPDHFKDLMDSFTNDDDDPIELESMFYNVETPDDSVEIDELFQDFSEIDISNYYS